MHCGKQHSRYCENPPTPPLPQAVKALSDHGVREFQVSELKIPPGRQVRRKAFCEYSEFVDSCLATGPVPAKHHADRQVPMPRSSLGAPGARRSATGRPGFVVFRGRSWQFVMSPRLDSNGAERSCRSDDHWLRSLIGSARLSAPFRPRRTSSGADYVLPRQRAIGISVTMSAKAPC